MRNAGNNDLDVIQFKYDKEKGYQVYCGNKEKMSRGLKDGIRIQKLEADALAVFGQNSYEYGEALKRAMVHLKRGDRTCWGILGEMSAHEFTFLGVDKLWRLNNEKYL